MSYTECTSFTLNTFQTTNHFLLGDKQFDLIVLIVHSPNSKMDGFLAEGNSKVFFSNWTKGTSN